MMKKCKEIRTCIKIRLQLKERKTYNEKEKTYKRRKNSSLYYSPILKTTNLLRERERFFFESLRYGRV